MSLDAFDTSHRARMAQPAPEPAGDLLAPPGHDSDSDRDSDSDIRIVRATPALLADAHLLLDEYFDRVGVVLRDDHEAIRAFLDEQGSAMWIAYVGDAPAGCVALRTLSVAQATVECKRMYVRDQFRRRGLAESLMHTLEQYAGQAGHAAIYLDTKDDLHAAVKLYGRLGYGACPRYNDNPQATIFMRKQLRTAP